MAGREGGTSWGLYAGIAVVAVALVAVAVWTTRESPPQREADSEMAAGTSGGEPSEPRAEAGTVPPSPPAVRAPAVRIPDKGRLRVTREALAEGNVLALGLELPDEARGEGVRAVKLVDVTGRVLELDGEPVDGSGTGLRLEIDPDWLVPGRYLVQVQTADASPLPVRRYVLEVTDEAEGSPSN